MRPHRFTPWLAALAMQLVLGLAVGGTARAQPLIDSEAALVAAVAAGGEYRLAAGTIDVREPLVAARDVRIVGAGRHESRLQLAGVPVGLRVQGGAQVHLATLALFHDADGGGDVIHVHDATLVLDGADVAFASFAPAPDGAKPFGYGSGLVLTGVAHAAIRSAIFGGHDLAAIEAYDRATLDVRGSMFVQNGTGVFVVDQTRTTIDDALFTENSGNSLAARGEAVVEVTRTTFETSGRVAADVDRQFDAVRIGDDAVVAFERSLFRGNPRFALSLFGSARVTSAGNLYEANGGMYEDLRLAYGAILVDDAAQFTSRGDLVRGNAGGILETNGDAQVTVDDATYETNGSWAPIYVVGRSVLTLTGSRYVGNDGAIFVAEDARATLHGNEIVDNGEASVWAVGRAELELVGNTVRGGAEDGVRLAERARAVLRQNSIRENRSGVVLIDESHAVLEDNDLSANGDVGIAFLDDAGGAAIGNRIGGHEVGVVVASSKDVELAGNAFAGNVEDVRRE